MNVQVQQSNNNRSVGRMKEKTSVYKYMGRKLVTQLEYTQYSKFSYNRRGWEEQPRSSMQEDKFDITHRQSIHTCQVLRF